MEHIELFTAYRSESGELEIVIADTDIACFCFMSNYLKFWNMVINSLEEIKNSSNYFKYEESDKKQLDYVINVIKEELNNERG